MGDISGFRIRTDCATHAGSDRDFVGWMIVIACD
jgi:hypothetical protein